MAIVIKTSASYSQVMQPIPFNPVRADLQFEAIAGLSRSFTEQNLTGGANGVAGYRTIAVDRVTLDQSNAYNSSVVDPTNITGIVIASRVTSSALMWGQVTNSRLAAIEPTAFQVFLSGTGRAAITISDLALTQPYFFAFSHTAAGTIKTYNGKAGAMRTESFTGGAAYTPSGLPILFGGNVVRPAEFQFFYGAVYNAIKSDSEIQQIYNAARERYFSKNADF